jgi:uncharacterized membrane protein
MKTHSDQSTPAREQSFSRNHVPEAIFKGQESAHPAVVTVTRPREEIFRFLRDFKNHALFVAGVKSVSQTSPQLFHFTADPHFGSSPHPEWDTEIIAENVDRMIAWRTVGESDFKQVGAITLEPAVGGRGTVVTLRIASEHKLGALVGVFAKLIGKDPKTQSAITLRRLKAYLETGEVPTIEGQPNGKDHLEKH